MSFQFLKNVTADGIVIATSGIRKNLTVEQLNTKNLYIHIENSNVFSAKNNALEKARQLGWKRIWLMDDDIKKFYYFELNKKGRNAWKFDESKVEMPADAVYGGIKYMSMSNEIVKNQFSESYANSQVVYLNLELLDKIQNWPNITSRGFEFIPETREDLLTGMFLIEMGYKCSHANLFAHSASLNGKESHFNFDYISRLGQNSFEILNKYFSNKVVLKYKDSLSPKLNNMSKSMIDKENHG